MLRALCRTGCGTGSPRRLRRSTGQFALPNLPAHARPETTMQHVVLGEDALRAGRCIGALRC